jgi:hypothetical protein
MMMRIILACALFVAACAPIQHTVEARQPVNRILTAGPGDILIHVDKQRNLENVFGASDIYGRKTNEGFSEVRFAGMEQDGTVVLFRNELAILTNESTLTRNPFTTSTTSGNTNVSRLGTSLDSDTRSTLETRSNTQTTTTLSRLPDFHTLIPSDAIQIRIPPGSRTFVFEGYTLTILKMEPNILTYSIAAN